MGTRLFTNNAKSTLASGISNVDTAITVATGHGAKFASPSAGNWQDVTLDDGTNIEIVRMTARSGDTLTVTRAQEGTTAVAFAAGTKVEARWTAGAAGDASQPAGNADIVIGGAWDNGSLAIVQADCKTVFVPVNAAGVIKRIEIVTDNLADGSCEIDVWKASGTYPDSGSSIAAVKPAIAAGRFYSDAVLTGLTTTAVAAGDRIGFHVNSVSTFKSLSIRMTIGASA